MSLARYTLALMEALQNGEPARVCIGTVYGPTGIKESTARSRITNAANQLGLAVSVRKVRDEDGRTYVESRNVRTPHPAGPVAVPNADQDRSYHDAWGLFDNDDADLAEPDPGPAWAQ